MDKFGYCFLMYFVHYFAALAAAGGQSSASGGDERDAAQHAASRLVRKSTIENDVDNIERVMWAQKQHRNRRYRHCR
jgi:hypothetical protein